MSNTIPPATRRKLTTNPYKWAGKSQAEYTKHWGDRVGWQNNRIGKGIENGSLSAREQRVLLNDQNRLQELYSSLLGDDGKLSYRDKLQLERSRNKESLKIYRLKHNGETA